jgi:hypothetical protein
MNPRDVPIPALMKHLPLDKRGYPIIPLVIKDENGPKFAVNDETLRARFMAEDRCGICGSKLFRARWLVGGPGSAFLENGAYLDPPMHGDCLHYAMKVCPYLAAPRWSGGVGKKQAASVKVPGGILAVLGSDGSDGLFPNRPEIFVAVQYIGQAAIHFGGDGLPVSEPPKPYRQVEYWIGGEQLSSAEGEAICAPLIEAMTAKYAEAHG